MNRVILTIDKQAVTPSGGLQTGITYEVDNYESGAVSGSRSERSVSLVADKLCPFKLADVPRIVADTPGRKPARLEVDGIQVFSGVAQVMEGQTVGGPYHRKDKTVKVALIGKNATWFPAFKNMSLAEILATYVTGETWGDAYAATHDNADPETDKHGLFLARTTLWGDAAGMVRTDLSFFAFITAILRDAFNRAGFHLDSDFWDSEEGRRYILPLPARPVGKDYGADYIAYMADQNNTTSLPSVGGGLPALIIIGGDAGNQNPGGHYNTTTGFYTVPFSGHYNVQVGGDGYNFYIPLTSTGGLVYTDSSAHAGTEHFTERVFLTAGTSIGLYAATATPGNTAKQSYLSIEPDFVFGPGYTIDLAMFCSADWMMDDFVLGLTDIFNLQFDTDVDAGRVRVEPKDRYLLISESGTAQSVPGYYRDGGEDWTTKIDHSKDGNPKIQSGKIKNRMKYEADAGDATAAEIDKNADLKHSEARYLFAGDRHEDGEETTTVRFFKKTLMYRANDLKHTSSLITPVLPLLQSEKYPGYNIEAQSTEPRILYFAGRRAGADGYVNLVLTPGVSLYDFPAAWFVPYNRATGTHAPSLSFANEQSNIGEAVPGLLQRLHLQKMRRKEVGIMLEDYARLTAVDIAALDFRNRIHLHGQSYILRRVENYVPGSTNSTKIILDADVAPLEADATKIQSSPITGIK